MAFYMFVSVNYLFILLHIFSEFFLVFLYICKELLTNYVYGLMYVMYNTEYVCLHKDLASFV